MLKGLSLSANFLVMGPSFNSNNFSQTKIFFYYGDEILNTVVRNASLGFSVLHSLSRIAVTCFHLGPRLIQFQVHWNPGRVPRFYFMEWALNPF